MSIAASTEQHTTWIKTWNEIAAKFGKDEAQRITDLVVRHFTDNGRADWGPSYEYGIQLMHDILRPPMDDAEYNDIMHGQAIMEELGQ